MSIVSASNTLFGVDTESVEPSSTSNMGLIIGLAVGLPLLVILAVIIALVVYKKHKASQALVTVNDGMNEQSHNDPI